VAGTSAEPRIRSLRLVFALFNFVAAKVLLGFNVQSVFTSNWVVLLQRDLLSGVLSILGSVIRTVTSEFAHESDEFALGVLFCHDSSLNVFLKIISTSEVDYSKLPLMNQDAKGVKYKLTLELTD